MQLDSLRALLNGARSHLAAGLTIDGHLTRDGQLENCVTSALSACIGVNVDLSRNGSLIAVPRIVTWESRAAKSVTEKVES
jgi:hypothetical protein